MESIEEVSENINYQELNSLNKSITSLKPSFYNTSTNRLESIKGRESRLKKKDMNEIPISKSILLAGDIPSAIYELLENSLNDIFSENYEKAYELLSHCLEMIQSIPETTSFIDAQVICFNNMAICNLK